MRARRTVLVTGATGFVGGHLVGRLLDEGAHVTALVRDRSRAEGLARRGVRLVEGDLADAGALRAACQGQQVVVHCAARALDVGPMDAFLRDNVDGTRAVAEAALGAGCGRFVHLSSISVYGVVPPPVVTEDTPLPNQARVYPYGESKRLAEEAVHAVARRGLATVIVRVGSVYGPGAAQWTLRPAKMARSRMGLVLVEDGRGLHNPIFIDDLVDGLQLAMDHPAAVGGVFNMTAGEAVTYREFFAHYVTMVRGRHGPMVSLGRRTALALAWVMERVGRATGRPVPITRIAVRLLVRRSVIRSDRACHTLGFAPSVGLEDGMAACHRWLAELGVAPPPPPSPPTARPGAS
jgi:nucleoside-diphosphate-sugar epimerase